MRSHPSSSSASLGPRLDTVFKKDDELTILCEVESCVIHYGRDGELKTWPEDREKVRNLALRYRQLDDAARRKKSLNLHGFLRKSKNKTHLQKKAKKAKTHQDNNDSDQKRETGLKNENILKYPLADHYSPHQVSHLTQSLELHVSKLQERLRFVESQKQKQTETTKLNHHHSSSIPVSLNHQISSTPISVSHHQQQTIPSNPGQFSLFLCNHGDSTLSQIPLSASNLTLLQQSGLTNQLMQNDHLYGCNQSTCSMDDNINDIYFQHPNTQDYSGLLAVQQSVDNVHELMQLEVYGFDENWCSSEFCSDFQDLYGNMVFSQDLSDWSSNLPSFP